MTRRCSHCSNNGHNSRTCPARGGGVRLFGVRLTDGVGAMKKSASMGCLSSAAAFSTAGASPSADPAGDHPDAAASGYASDEPAHASSSSICRKKGVPWTEEEHRMFLVGLQQLGKGDWRGIARNFVISRTPTQVASHAQKYFIRQSNSSRRKRRSSLFDMPIDQISANEERLTSNSPPNEVENTNHLPTLHLNEQGAEFLGTKTTKYAPEQRETIPQTQNSVTMIPTYYPAFIPVPLPYWPLNLTTVAKEEEMKEAHEILKPIAVVPKEALNVEEVVGISKLSIGDGTNSRMDPSALSLKLVGSSSARQSAFQVNSSVALPDLNQSNSSPIHAV
ncbi:transcription factor MYBS3-like [Musa acuminata AAA Group]|uniref:transcription factor MYBS3 n=1 Tax=Musa acuminata AAA Group TaxID=214697 RepID=UPI0031DF1273